MLVDTRKLVPIHAACHAIVVTQPVMYDRKFDQAGGARIATLGEYEYTLV